jgi:hypothetical protein
LALLLRQKPGSVEQRLREWCYEAECKRGKQRQEVDVSGCWLPPIPYRYRGA